jgi:ketosteroid isomerase-like protein
MNPPSRHTTNRAVVTARVAVSAISALMMTMSAAASVDDDRRAVAELDRAYQAAVKANDVATMGRILHEDFVLVLGNGESVDRNDLLREAREGLYHYDQQDEDPGTQTVRVWGDTAVVTARLWVKGQRGGKPFDRRLWFSDTYVRTPDGWKYVFGQASLPLPADPARTDEARSLEIRSYSLIPGTRERFHRLFVDEALPLLERWQIDVVAFGRSRHDDNSYFLVRSYPDLDARQQSEDTFYGSKDWRDGPRQDILDCIENYTTVVVPASDEVIARLRALWPQSTADDT